MDPGDGLAAVGGTAAAFRQARASRVNRLRNRLILVFLAATLAPLGATLWVTGLLNWNPNYTAVNQLKTLAQSLGRAGRELQTQTRARLKQEALSGQLTPEKFGDSNRAQWPEAVRRFTESNQAEHFPKVEGDTVQYLTRHGSEVWVYSMQLGDVHMDQLERQIRNAGALAEAVNERDLHRGFLLTYILLAASFWIISIAVLIYLAHRISRPIHSLTVGLTRVASGDLNARVPASSDDEVGRAILAFNGMAEQLKATTERLVTVRQLEGLQLLARKMAHEVKNSLTPIRLTVEEMIERYDEADRQFMEQAAQIVVDEIETLERRVRAFSQFAAEPPVRPQAVEVNAMLQERVAFLKTAHAEVAYECRLDQSAPEAFVDLDLLKGILTNLLENAAEAAGEGGRILAASAADNGCVSIEVHDSGPGLSEQARASLFQPTISFKKRGMGLGLSIARRSALLSDGDIVLVKGELGGAGFRVLLPRANHGDQTRSDRG
jgi:two-component system, NtrC family, nitrogen regulation sensor histidine kinase NtrY